MTPFVIVGLPRTGSTLLRTGLSQHPDIRAYGELLHEHSDQRLGPHAIVRGEEKIAYRDALEDAVAFLKREVFFHPDETAQAIGFKLFAEYVRGEGTKDLFQRLKEELPRLKVVHIVRSNYLDALVSREVAQRTKSWVSYAGAETPAVETPRIRIHPLDALRFFAQYERGDQQLAEAFGGENYVRVDYDTLTQDYSTVINQVYAHLGVGPFEPKQAVKKQLTKRTDDTLENFGELRRHFRGTAYGKYFTKGYAPLEFPQANEMRIGDFHFDLDSSAAVREKFSEEKRFVLMKSRRLIEQYVSLFEELTPANVFELGIRRGGSMAFYNLAFKPARHVAIEIDTGPIPALDSVVDWAKADGRRMTPYFGVDQADAERLGEIMSAEFGAVERPLDLVLDDASHRADLSQRSFETLFPRLRQGGLYGIEDWGWAHWQGFQGTNAYFANEPALSNLIFKLTILHTCRPDIIKEIRITPVVAYFERGPTALNPATFRIDDFLVLRGKSLPEI
ncbi:MAG: sulfotransferase [Terricaulis sp.]